MKKYFALSILNYCPSTLKLGAENHSRHFDTHKKYTNYMPTFILYKEDTS